MTDYLAYAARGRNAWWRYVLAIGLALILATVLTAVVVAIALQIAHLSPADFARRIQDPSHPLGFFFFNGLTFLLVLAGFAGAIALVHRKRPGDVVGAWTWSAFGAGLAAWAAALIVLTLIDVALRPSGFRVSANRDTPLLAIAALGGLAVQTFAEEFVFRGYLTQGLLLATKRVVPTAVISGLLFGALHIPNGWPQAVNAALFGVVLALIAIRTGGIAFGYGVHLTNNLFAAVVLVSSGDAFRGSPGLFTQNTPQLMWWDTGAGAVVLIALAVVVYRRPVRPASVPA
jgi:membrane protease YdiL (CAAX protease family)